MVEAATTVIESASAATTHVCKDEMFRCKQR